MLKYRFVGFSLLVVVSAGAWACGSDSDDAAAPPTATAGGGGTAGSTAGNGGSSGSTAGNGGSSGSTAGSAGTAGGTAGSGAGTGGQAGMGGEAGATSDPLPADCASMCADQAAISCTLGSQCVDDCTGKAGIVAVPAEYADMVACLAASLAPADYECSNMTGGVVWVSPKAGTTCETKICTFTCNEVSLGIGIADENVFGRCNCP